MEREDNPPAVLARIREKLARAAASSERAGQAPAAVLRQRALELARELPPEGAGELLQVIRFRLGPERLALEATWIKEVLVPRAIVQVPGAPAFIAGLVNLRGTIISVVDLRQVLALPEAPGEGAGTVLILTDGEREFGILADRVEEVRDVPRRDLAPPPATLSEPARHYLQGVLPGAVSLLDASLLLQSPRLRVDQSEKPHS